MNAPLSIQIVPAQPGFLTVLESVDPKEVFLGDPIIAWRVETYSTGRKDSMRSICVPLTVHGEAEENCIGVQYPDKTFTVFDESTYESLEALQASRYPK